MRNLVINLSNVPSYLLENIERELNEIERAVGIKTTELVDTMNIDFMTLPLISKEQLLAPIVSAYFCCKIE